MVDPLSEIIALLAPSAPDTKLAEASSIYKVQRDNIDRLFYCLPLMGEVLVEVDNEAPILLNKDDFILIPEAHRATLSSVKPTTPKFVSEPIKKGNGRVWFGAEGGNITSQLLIGHCHFESKDKSLLLSLLPKTIVISGVEQIVAIASLIREEVLSEKPASDVIVKHLLQILLIKAFRSAHHSSNLPSLICGLSDKRIGKSLRALHNTPSDSWTASRLAKEAGMSRSAYFSLFRDTVGMTPINYLLNWRMAKAKSLLSQGTDSITNIAFEVGYGSASSFSSAFQRHVGVSPSKFRDFIS